MKFRKVAPPWVNIFVDAELLCTIFEAAKFYFFNRSSNHINHDDFRGFILIVAVKNKRHDTAMRLLENYIPKTSFLENDCLEGALAVASTLASQFVKQQLIDKLHANSERDWSRISLFSWAVQCGYVTVVQLLFVEGLSVSGEDPEDEHRGSPLHWAARNGNGHEAVVRLLLEKGAKRLQ